MAIVINNTANVRAWAEELSVESNKIEAVKDSIDYILKELNQYWSDTQEDQQGFYNGLKDGVEALNIIHTCNYEFANAMVEYMDVTDKTSSTTV